MKNYLILIFLTALVGCGPNNENTNFSETQLGGGYGTVLTVEHDSCEYVLHYGTGIIHKQNCKFCKQRAK